jgi:hypothetical protein
VVVVVVEHISNMFEYIWRMCRSYVGQIWSMLGAYQEHVWTISGAYSEHMMTDLYSVLVHIEIGQR